jgi:hypothetical protein
MQAKTITYYSTEVKSADLVPCNRLLQPPRDTRFKVTLVPRPLPMPVAQKWCRYEHGTFASRACVYSRVWLSLLNQTHSKFVLRRYVSHLLLLRTNFGYGTVWTAPSARQGCSATDYYYYDFTSQSPAAVREAFSKKVPNNATINRLVTKSRCQNLLIQFTSLMEENDGSARYNNGTTVEAANTTALLQSLWWANAGA